MSYMNIQLNLDTNEQIEAVLTALAGCDHSPVGLVPAGTPVDLNAGLPNPLPADGELEDHAKPKRKRRTKAELAAAKAAKAAKAEAAVEPSDDEDPLAEVATPPGPAATPVVAMADVRQVIVDAVDRIKEAGRPKTAAKEVVAELKTLTGKGKLAEIDAADYQKVIDHLVALAV